MPETNEAPINDSQEAQLLAIDNELMGIEPEPENPEKEQAPEPELALDTPEAEAEPEVEPEGVQIDYDLEIPMPGGGDTITLGKLKDQYVEQQRSESAIIDRENDVLRRTNELAQAIQAAWEHGWRPGV